MFEMNAGLPVSPFNQRYRDYARQRQMTLSDLLLENRIIFLGSSPETGGAQKRRYALPNSKVMIHQPWGQVGGQISDIEIQANEIMKERHRLNEILAQHTGQELPRIEKETDRDRYFSAQEAKDFGLVDEVIQ